MSAELIETITKLILEKIAESSERVTPAKQTVSDSGMVKLWDHLSTTPHYVVTGAEQLVYPEQARKQEKLVKFRDHVGTTSASEQHVHQMMIEDVILPELQTRIGVDSPRDAEALKEWVKKTPARVGVGRAGLRPKTETWLRFRLDHGAAVDAVYGSVPPDLLESLKLFSVNTMVDHKEEYIRRPDLGRKLSEEAKIRIRENCQFQPKVQIIASDGLSSQAIEKNLEDVYLSFLQSLDHLGMEYGTPFYIEKGRVASMDEVGDVLQPEVVVLFIGERPGLVSSESLSAYLCYKPRKGTIEADRMVISNIHAGGIPPVEAGAYLGSVVQKILKYQASGVSLVRKER
jgi:ethanolamine ammonia-lyase small subunit